MLEHLGWWRREERVSVKNRLQIADCSHNDDYQHHHIITIISITISSDTMVTSLASLPDEVLVPIAAVLDQQDALALLYSAKAFAHAARLRLYRRILICEKHQDTYFYRLSRRHKFTLLSSWKSITRFFKYLHAHRSSCIYDYVEELSSYNFLDHGNKIDSYKYLSASDLNNILSLRQCWEIVLNNFKGLKKFVFPKLPIEKLMLLSSDIKANLVEISINLEDDHGIEELPQLKELFKFPKLKKLVLNLDHRLEVNGTMFVILQCILDDHKNTQNEGGVIENDVLEELEINGNFGKLDRDFEHFLRHCSIDKDVSLKSSFLKGYETGEQLHKYGRTVNELTNGRKMKQTTVVDLETFEDVHDAVEEDEENDDEDDEEGDAQDDDIIDVDSSDSDFEEHDEDELAPVLDNVQFNETHINNLNFGYNSFEYSTAIVQFLDTYKFNKLQKLTFSHLNFNSQQADYLRNILTLHSSHLKSLHFNNCYILYPFGADAATQSDTIDPIKLINEIPGDVPVPQLKDFTFSLTPLDFSITESNYSFLLEQVLVDGINLYYDIPSDVKPRIREIEDMHLANLELFIIRSENLENLKIHLSSTTLKLVNFVNLFKSIITVKPDLSLKHIKFFNKVDIFKIIRKLINIKIFKKFNNFNNLNLIDDYHFGLFKELIEFFNGVSRVDNYGTQVFETLRTTENHGVCLFEQEFKYLFREEVKFFFQALQSLESFEYFGFTFYRKDVL